MLSAFAIRRAWKDEWVVVQSVTSSLALARPLLVWRPPPTCVIKINADGALCVEDNIASMGCVVWNDSRCCWRSAMGQTAVVV